MSNYSVIFKKEIVVDKTVNILRITCLLNSKEEKIIKRYTYKRNNEMQRNNDNTVTYKIEMSKFTYLTLILRLIV
jgi:hypothetical protein